MSFYVNSIGTGRVTIPSTFTINEADPLSFNLSANTNLTLPDSGTLATTDGVGSVGYVRLARVITTSSATVIEFDAIPQTYSHLKIILVGSQTDSSYADINMIYNGVASSTYNYTNWYQNGGGSPSAASGTLTSFPIGPANDAGTIFEERYASITTIEIPFYTMTTFYKTTLFCNGFVNFPNTEQRLTYGVLTNEDTAAISSISIFIPGGGNFYDGTMCDLYGLN